MIGEPGQLRGRRFGNIVLVAGESPLPLDAGWIGLTTGWQEFRIEATERDLSRVVTPFMVIANDKHNPGGRITVFLDDIRWERGG